MHDVIVVGVPLIAILAGAMFNNRDISRLEGRLDRIQAELTSMRSEIHKEFEQFYRTLGQHDARIENLEKHQ